VFKNLIISVFFVGAIFVNPNTNAQDELGFFIEIQKAPRASLSDQPTEETVVRSRSVIANPNKFPNATRKPGYILPLNVFPDCEIEVVLDTLEKRDEEDFTWTGFVGNEGDGGSATIVVKGEIMVGNIRSEKDGYYQIRMDSAGDMVVREIDEAKFAQCDTEDTDSVDSPSVPKAFFQLDAEDSSDIFDVMVIYTPAARVAVGGTAAMEALINLAVSETNTAYTESAIDSQVRLVHQQELTYIEISSATDLTSLRGNGDGVLDTVHTLRNTHGADLVSLFADYSGTTCGRASVMTSLSSGFESSAFSVVSYDCATGYFSFAHEMAHNMGSMHAQPESTQGSGLYGYSMGWRWNGNAQRSIMAYSPGTRVARFSNPDVLYNGFPTGETLGLLDEANNALSINNAASTIANWRTAVNLSTVTPETDLSSSGPQGGIISPDTETYTLYNPSASSIDWSASKTENWLSLSTTGGTLAAAASVDIVVSINENAQGLAMGEHSDTVSIYDISNDLLAVRIVSLNILSPFIVLQSYSSADVPLSISSNAVIESTLLVLESSIISDVNVTLDISHTWDSDLDVSLESPDGTVIQLFSGVGGSGDNFSGTILDDEAEGSIQFGSAPFLGSYQPDGSLSDLDTEDVMGEWTLFAADLVSGDEGTLNSWSIEIETSNQGAVVYTDFANDSGIENGSEFSPWNTLAEALSDVDEGGIIKLVGDSDVNATTEVFTRPALLDVAVILEAENGIVQIGVSP